MTEAEVEWEALPEVLRARVDELVLVDEWFAAVHALWTSGSGAERISLQDCQRLVFRRRSTLADRVQPKPEPPRDLATLIAKVCELPNRPDAIEAIWDGDSVGWMVRLVAVTADPRAEHCLAMIRHGGDLRLFNGQVPPWTESEEATELGTGLAKHFSVPFYFEHADAPDLPDVRWCDTR
ncbi:hypothetical protein ABH935_005942 [Catenulispora sp. GAS73]|uniref:hypothetical protein n=1 Tax=Catenulispora sp. GAS73 TaxID=3156269 RepID=UPI0035158268